MTCKDSVYTDTCSSKDVLNEVSWNLMPLTTKNTDTSSTPTWFNGVVKEFIIFLSCGICPIWNTWPDSQTIITIPTDIRVFYCWILGSLSKVNTISQVITDTSIFNDKTIRVLHISRLVIVSNPHTNFKMLNPDVMNFRILAKCSRNSLVLCILVITRGQVGIHIKIAQLDTITIMTEDNPTTIAFITCEVQLCMPNTSTWNL